MIEEGPHEWEAPDWRMRCNSFSGIVDSCPMNYKEIIHDLQGSDQAKDKELMGILDQIKECSILFGQADDHLTFHQMKWQCCCQMLHWIVMKSVQ